MNADASVDNPQQKQREFLTLLPLTIQIAGMPPAEQGKLLTDGQMEARITSLKTAYKFARQMMIELSQ